MRISWKALILAILMLQLGLSADLWAKGSEKAKLESDLGDLKYVEGDEAGNEVKALKTELLVAASETKAIEQVKKLIRKHRGSYLEPDLWFRLAELYMRRAKTERFFEIHRHSETVVKLAPKVVKKASSKKAVTDAIGIYENIQRRFKSFPEMDLVIFNNAFARQTIGQDSEAEKRYWKLIRSYKSSPLVPDAHLAIGEINFDNKKFGKALEHFLAIEKYPNSRVYPYGLYKSGWSYYNLHEAVKGIKKLEEVVEYGRKVAEENIDARLDLRKEALADMTIFYEDVYPAKNAFAYFSEQAGELEVEPVILKLSALYERHSRYSDKEVILRDLIKKRPKSEVIPEAHDQLAWNYENMKKREDVVAELEKFYKICDPQGSWADAQYDKLSSEEREKLPVADLSAVKECQKTLNGTTLRLADKWLRTWKKNPDYPIFADSAEKVFEIYLRRSDGGQKAKEARFAYAELLFQRKKYRQASSEYAQVSSDNPVKSLSHDASYAALLSLEKAVGDKWNDTDEKSFHALATNYVNNHPKGKYRLGVEFKVALIAYEKERYEEAGPIFVRLGRDFPKEEKGQKAQDLYLDILNIKKDYKGLKEYSKELITIGGESTRMAKLQKVYEEAWFLQIQQIEEKGDLKLAVQEYTEFGKENPKSELAEKALWNATQLMYKTFDYAQAADAGVAYATRFPKSKQATDALLKAAQTYESMGQLEEAAKILPRLAKRDEKNAEKWNALTADFLMLSGRYAKAKNILDELIKSPNPKVVGGALEHLALIAAKHNDTVTKQKVRERMIASGVQPQASLALLKEVEELFQSSQQAKAFAEAKKVLNMGSDASSFAKSKARFIQARILEDEFVRQSVKSQADRVALVLALKTEKLEKAQRAYQSAMRYGDPYVAVESMQRLSGCYKHYVEALRSMPLPEGLTSEDEPAFRAELDQLAIPLEEKSVETLARALEKAKDLKLRDGTIASLRKELDRVNMRPSTRLSLEFKPAAMAVPVPKGVGS